MKPLISIVMPVYNCEGFIQESIGSIIDQTYENWELIIINDGSSDSTLDKIMQIKDNRIRIINLEKHSGLTAAFMEGYKHINGEYVLRHDGDDKSAERRLELQLSFLESNPDISMVSCLISCFTREPGFRKDCVFIERVQNFYITAEDIEKSVLGGFIPVLFPTLLIRRKVMDEAMAECNTPSFDDHTELLLKLIALSPIRKVNTILYYYRRHSNAFHILNQIEYEKYSSNLLKSTEIKNRLQYKDFYDGFNISDEQKCKLNQKSPIKVLMLVDALNVGGTETHVLNITKKLIEKGIYVVIATSGGPMEGLFESLGIKIIKFPFEGDYISNKKKNGLVKLLKAIVDKEEINIVHAHLFASMQLASELYRLYKIPYIVTIHGLFYPNDILYSSCIKASGIIAVSEPVQKSLCEKLNNRVSNKIKVIPNGINIDLIEKAGIDRDIGKELSLPKNAKLLCYCSRLDWNKTEAARVLLFVFSRLFKEFSNLHVVIIGDGPGKTSIEKEAQIINEMTGKEIVHVVGAKMNVIPYYRKSSIVIGTARVALEAMICKKPVIAIGNQGYSGIITKNNFMKQWQMYFGDHDALGKPNVTKLAEDIRYLMQIPERRRRIGLWGRRWCEKFFNNDKIVNYIIMLYKKALE